MTKTDGIEAFNKLILIGNGFDLAHGLKTSYNHFMEDYVSKAVGNVEKEKSYSDELVDLKDKSHLAVNLLPKSPDNVGNVFERESIKRESIKKLSVKYKSSFLKKLHKKSTERGWVNIEQEYYDLFVEIIKSEKKENKFSELNQLNKDLKKLAELLHGYLENEFKKLKPSNQEFSRVFKNLNLKASDHILSFNYTRTPFIYQQIEKVNFIHGEIKKEDNPIVFGFGDERDKNYELIEDLNENSILNHFKSFAYIRNGNLAKLLKFIDSEPFEVHTIGLSCGLSDRTLLSQVFEHKHCEKIYIYHHKGMEGYQDVARNISRHFSDKQEFRRKLVNFEDCLPCPS
ncbi:MAG: bacteriophage abortive infection AbiH family protein [Cyclobacteriaceae bacterium]|nr:hypothetical protein [Cyclobacteriaceae bacterium]MCH8514788.1 bacteriophage abortive infection AbiH family protein [Cyclobacteriaceae bacterium]